jgi:predicted DNA-binding transcriptional regulator AlpA
MVSSITENDEQQDRLIRFPELHGIIPLSRTTIWRLTRSGKMPLPRKCGGAKMWSLREIQDWMQNLERSGGE